MKVLKALAIGTVPLVGAFLCLLLLQVSAAIQQASRDEANVTTEALLTLKAVNQPCDQNGASCGVLAQTDAAIVQVAEAAGSANATIRTANSTLGSATQILTTVNQPCGNGRPCGTLADVAKTLNTVRGTFGEVEIAANHEDRNLSHLDKQEDDLFSSFQSTINQGVSTMDAAETSLHSLNALLADPAIPVTMKNVASSTGTMDHMLFTADAVETKATHDYLHPSKNPWVRTWRAAQPFIVPTVQIGGAVAAAAIK